MPTNVKRYLLRRNTDQLVIEVPDSWKVTFGPLTPGQLSYSGDKGWTVRFYETKDKQRAIFQNVLEMRDLSIPVKHYGPGEQIPNDAFQGHGDPNVGAALSALDDLVVSNKAGHFIADDKALRWDDKALRWYD